MVISARDELGSSQTPASFCVSEDKMLAAPKRSWRHAGLVGALLITSCVDSTAPALPHAPASIEISGSGSLVIYMGFQVALTAVVKDGLGSTVSHGVMWSSSNPGVAAVTSSGVV